MIAKLERDGKVAVSWARELARKQGNKIVSAYVTQMLESIYPMLS